MNVQQREIDMLAANHLQGLEPIGSQNRSVATSGKSFSQGQSKVAIVVRDQQVWL
jgi:hypothetical protein